MTTKNAKPLNRRNFFAGAAALAGSAVILAKTPVGQQVISAVEDSLTSPKKTGYQLTEHIQKYYKTTLV